MVTRRCQRGGGGDLLFFFFCTKMIRLCVWFNLNGFFYFFYFPEGSNSIAHMKREQFSSSIACVIFPQNSIDESIALDFFFLLVSIRCSTLHFFLIDLTPLRAWVISAWVYLWKLFKSHSRAPSRHPAGIRRNGSATPYPLLRAHQWEFQMQLFAQQVFSQCGSKREKQVFRYKNLTCC